jgi:Na+-transporting NADH:ubiquinone oxidoreductase subunit NqrB
MSEENNTQNATAAEVSGSDNVPTGQVPRLGFAANVSEAAKHIHTSVNSQGTSVRASDKLSAFLVPATSAGLMAAVLCAGWARMAISVICMAALLYYILGRIGIMRTLNARQATLIWHIILGTFLLGIVFTFVYLEIVNRVK